MKKPTLARFDGSGWTTFDQTDGVPRMDDLHGNEDWGFFEIAPDGSYRQEHQSYSQCHHLR